MHYTCREISSTTTLIERITHLFKEKITLDNAAIEYYQNINTYMTIMSFN